ncbi:MAG: HRDC domain-containing protein [Syntrophobacteraceae bacterium]|nr:HRDC domain-containing protein [Syntrophobacteraceae bacterium]
MELNSVVLIENRRDFSNFLQELENSTHVAIDTESNSFYAYFNRVCLIQVSTSEQDYIIDPLSVGDIHDLGETLSNPDVEKIFHAAPNDIAGLKRDFKFVVHNVFDTSIAAKILGYKQLGLAPILQEHFGVSLNKKWQRYDWGKRPLKEEQIEYARFDTHFLIPLRHRLACELEEKQLFDSAREAFEKLCTQQIVKKHFRPGDFLHICGAQSLDVVGKRVLKALYLFREKEARRRDRAPFRVLTNETLLKIALQRPKSVQDFNKIKGIPRVYLSSHAAFQLLDLIRRSEEQEDEAAVK